MSDFQCCTITINENGDDYCIFDSSHEIVFEFHHDVYTKNKIKLTNQKLIGFNRHTVYIDADSLMNNFVDVLSLFQIRNHMYRVPFAIMLRIMKHYDKNYYTKIKPYHNKEHDILAFKNTIEEYEKKITSIGCLMGEFVHD